LDLGPNPMPFQNRLDDASAEKASVGFDFAD
jgi:hypothetical protein